MRKMTFWRVAAGVLIIALAAVFYFYRFERKDSVQKALEGDIPAFQQPEGWADLAPADEESCEKEVPEPCEDSPTEK